MNKAGDLMLLRSPEKRQLGAALMKRKWRRKSFLLWKFHLCSRQIFQNVGAREKYTHRGA